MESKRTLVVTGASRGLGKALIDAALENKELNVIAVTRNAKQLEEKYKNSLHKPIIIAFDISKQLHEVDTLTKAIVKDFSSVDFLINNAATIVVKPFNEFLVTDMQELYQTNVFAPFKIIQELVPLMANKKETTHIVNIGSMGGFQGSVKFPGLSLYASSKAALANLSEGLAVELSPLNIAVNCLALGSVKTEMLKSAFPDYTGGTTPKEMANYVLNFILSGQKVFNGKILPVSNSTP
ncbi:MAG: SDR family oxidoreductase [Bacteroidia bacterium]|nr:SDR family oxidoreductase [Bacteroidia bacterium]